MTNAFGVVLDNASVRRAAVEGVPESVIAAIYLLHERSVDEIAAKLRRDELGHVIRLVSRCPSCYPPGTLEALKVRSPAPSPERVATISTDRPPARIEPDAEDVRRAKEGRLARLRVNAQKTVSEQPCGLAAMLGARFAQGGRDGGSLMLDAVRSDQSGGRAQMAFRSRTDQP
jgi:hypothetical protein